MQEFHFAIRSVFQQRRRLMYSITPLGLGNQGLQNAISEVLSLAKVVTFPTGTWTISPEAFDKMVAAILQRTAGIQVVEVQAALIQRGYKPGRRISATPTPAPTPYAINTHRRTN